MTARKIGRIETFHVPPRWLFVRVESEDGAVGWGEASLEGWAEAVDGAFEAFRDRFIGADPFAIEDIWQVGYRGGFYRGGPVLMSALAGLEQALVGLFEGPRSRTARMADAGRQGSRKGALLRLDRRRPAARDRRRRRRPQGQQGFTAVKMNATADLDWIGTPGPVNQVVKRVEAAQAQGMDVGLDFHGRVHRPLAKQLAKVLEPLGLLLIEEPLLSENPEGLKQIAELVFDPDRAGRAAISAAGISSRSSRWARSTSSSPTSATPAGSSRCGRSPRWPRPMTSRLRRIARSGPWRSAPACRSQPAPRTMRSRRSASASTTIRAGTTSSNFCLIPLLGKLGQSIIDCPSFELELLYLLT